ncbi:hypothetical protein [Tabrizicola aquatica]|nr:hypothetical protein [Tabrizicola aquatica]
MSHRFPPLRPPVLPVRSVSVAGRGDVLASLPVVELLLCAALGLLLLLA